MVLSTVSRDAMGVPMTAVTKPADPVFPYRYLFNQSGKFCAATGSSIGRVCAHASAPSHELFLVAGLIEKGTVIFEEPAEIKERPDKYTLQFDDERHLVNICPCAEVFLSNQSIEVFVVSFAADR